MFQQIGREQAVPVAIALAQDHADAHAIGCRVDVAAAQRAQLAQAQPAGIRGHQQGAGLQSARRAAHWRPITSLVVSPLEFMQGLAVGGSRTASANALPCTWFSPLKDRSAEPNRATCKTASVDNSRGNGERVPSERKEFAMISRHWRGLAHPARADEYVQHLRSDTFPKLSNIPGFIGASILKRNMTQGVEFLVVTNWESIGAIEQFSGRDPELAIVPSEVHEMMLDYDRRVRHYEVLPLTSER